MANPHLYVRYKARVSRFWIYLILSGCYAPHEVPTGSPCSVAEPTCPEGQNCIRVDGEFLCESMAPTDAAGSHAHDGPPGTTRLRFPATANGCVSEMYGTALCQKLYPGNQLVVTSSDSFTMMPIGVYLRFEPDSALIGKVIAGITLELTAQDTAMAASSSGGAVWRANAFTESSIMNTSPGTIGAAITGDAGAVAEGATVDWPLAGVIATPGAPLCFAIRSTSMDETAYENRQSATPPTLIVDVF